MCFAWPRWHTKSHIVVVELQSKICDLSIKKVCKKNNTALYFLVVKHKYGTKNQGLQKFVPGSKV